MSMGVRACARVCWHMCPCVCECAACVLAPEPYVCECVRTCLCVGWPRALPCSLLLCGLTGGSVSRKSWLFSALPQLPFPPAHRRQKGRLSCWWVPRLPSEDDPALTRVLGMSAGSAVISRETEGCFPGPSEQPQEGVQGVRGRPGGRAPPLLPPFSWALSDPHTTHRSLSETEMPL